MDLYDKYLYDLAAEINCGLRLAPDLPGMMYVEFGYVEGPHPYNSKSFTPQEAFAVGLHELGHFALGHTQGRPPYEEQTFYFKNGVLKSEAEAWDYALQHFEFRQEVIDPRTRLFMWRRCLNSYYQGSLQANGAMTRLMNGDRGYVAFKYDKPGQEFNEVRQKIIGAI